MDLNITWFLLVFVLLGGYAILDGFDLGVGVLHLFAGDEFERRVHLNAIGPVWDGNEVWLLTGGGALFAAFPVVYATVFSGFYLALMLLLMALICRAVGIEFRGKVESLRWKRFWDMVFGISSLVAALLLGVAFGNILRGIPLDEQQNYAGTFFTLLNPLALLIGILSVALFTLHGALYLVMKSEGDLHERLRKWVPGLWVAVVALYAAATATTFFVSPFLFTGLLNQPLFWVFLLLVTWGMLSIPVASAANRGGLAFIGSSSLIGGIMGLSAVSLFPRLVPALGNLANSLDIRNAASTPRTLKVMLIIALIGMPLVIIYTAYIYRAFKGKVKLGHESY